MTAAPMDPFRRQLPAYSPIGLADLRGSVRDGLRGDGDPRQRLAAELRRRFEASRVVLCGGGTMALQLALDRALADRDGGAVALPAYTCYDVASAAVASGARILLYDLDPDTLGPDFDSLRRALERGARVAVIAPLFGVPVDWDAVAAALSPHGALAVEDAAQGHGALWDGRPLGALGPVSVLSFARGKGWTGIRGGALLARGALAEGPPPQLEPPAGGLSETAVAALGQWALGRPRLYALPAAVPWLQLGRTRYREPRPPREMARIGAALLCETREAADREAEARRRNAAALLESLPHRVGIRSVRPPAGGRPGYLRLPLRLAGGMAGFGDPEAAARLGAAPGYPGTLARLPALRGRLAAGSGDELPGAAELAAELVTLPTHSRVSVAERTEMLHLLNGRASR